MKRMNKMSASLADFGSGASLGGKVSQYRNKQNIYKQGTPAYTLFYIQAGGVRLTTRTKHQSSAVTAILGVHDFFGELCLAGYPLRMSTAVALTASSIRTIQKKKMLQMLRKKNKTSNALVAYLLSSVKSYRDHVANLLTSSAEQRLARWLLTAHDRVTRDRFHLTHDFIAMMIGIRRPSVTEVMGILRDVGGIEYAHGDIRVIDRAVLESRACECYAAMRREIDDAARDSSPR